MAEQQLRGTVVSGIGVGAGFVALAWVREAIRQAAGFDPYPGTLNVRLADAESRNRWRRLRGEPGLPLTPPPPAPCGGRLFPVRLAGDIPAAVVVPDMTEHGDDLLEIVAAEHLRSRLRLGDGDRVVVLATSQPR